MLIKEQIAKIVIDNGLTVKHNHEVVLTEQGLEASMQAAYAAGAKDMRERCARVCGEISSKAHEEWKAKYNPHDQGVEMGADDCEQAIKALETT